LSLNPPPERGSIIEHLAYLASQALWGERLGNDECPDGD
jgi:hypothetical protein